MSERMENTERQGLAADGLIQRAARLLGERESSPTQSETRPEGAEQISRYVQINSEADTGLIEAFSERIRDTVRFSPPFLEYSLATSLRDATYRRLQAGDTASTHIISLTLAVTIELILACFVVVNMSQGIHIMSIVDNLVIGVVYAQAAVPGPATSPQSTVVGLVWLAALMLAMVILGLLWSGYLAKSKNEKAQTILQHLVNTVLSVATGAVISRGFPNV